MRTLLKLSGLAIAASAVLAGAAYAQAPAAPAAGRGGSAQGPGAAGDLDPGVHYIVVIDNPSVRVLQVTLQPGAVRRDHVHNDVTFNVLVPVTGSLELSTGSTTAPTGRDMIVTVPGQAYYIVKGQPHSFTNKTAAPGQ